MRNRALLLLAFGGALRRSELVALDLADVTVVDQGVELRLRRSKTDQEGEEATCHPRRNRSGALPAPGADRLVGRSGRGDGGRRGPTGRLGAGGP